jgi:PAS domain S-box-containing protein
LAEQEFALVLLDLSLPDSWGFETISRVQHHAPHVPIVVLTGLDDDEFAVTTVQKGAQDFLVKGQVTASGLLRTIRYAIERHRLRQALHASESRYRDLFESASDAILSFTLEGIVTNVNRGLELMLGWNRQELIGQHYRQLLTPSSIAHVEERAREIAQGEPPRTPPVMELEAVRKDGSTLPVEVRDNALYDAPGKLAGVFMMARDISLRKELEQKRSEFFAMLSHDIKNPLAVVIGYADYLQNEARTHGSVKSIEVLPWIKSGALTVLSLVNNYLDLSRIEDQQLTLAAEPVVLNDLLKRIGSHYEGEAAHRQITLTLALQPQLPWVEGDLLALDRVFTNLVYNALKFTPKEGTITIRSASQGQDVVVTIANSGPGISAEEMPLLFEKYRRTKSARYKEGMGLGLFIVKTLVERHAGRVEVESSPNSGTQFRVILPARKR